MLHHSFGGAGIYYFCAAFYYPRLGFYALLSSPRCEGLQKGHYIFWFDWFVVTLLSVPLLLPTFFGKRGIFHPFPPTMCILSPLNFIIMWLILFNEHTLICNSCYEVAYTLVGKYSVLGNFSGQNAFSKIVARIV